MFFHTTVFFYSLLAFIGFELIALPSVADFLISVMTDRPIIFALFLLSVVAAVYQIAIKIGKKSEMTPIPIVFVLSSSTLLFLIDSPFQQQIFILLISALYYFIHLSIYRLRFCLHDQTARGIVSAGAIGALFLFYAASYGIYINFAIDLWILMIFFLLVTISTTFQYLILTDRGKNEVLRYSIVLGLIMSEIAWVVNFWPFGYLTTGVITLIFYYVFWDITQAHFLSMLSKKRVVSVLLLVVVLVGMVLLTSKWVAVV